MTHRAHVFVSGRVQGVGYRYSAFIRAQSLGLNGWVRNLRDGRVEAEFEGSNTAVEDMIAWCGEGPRSARVERIVVTREEGEPRYRDFRFGLE